MISWIYILILTFSLFLPSFLPLVWLDEEVDDYATIYVTTVSCRAMFITHIYGLSLSLSWLLVRNLLYNSIGSLLTWAMNPNLRPLFFYLFNFIARIGNCGTLFVCLSVCWLPGYSLNTNWLSAARNRFERPVFCTHTSCPYFYLYILYPNILFYSNTS